MPEDFEKDILWASNGRLTGQDSVIEAINTPFSKNGLCFVQSPEFSEKGVVVTTRIMHKSGQWIEGSILIPVLKNDAQAVGSAITYGKRYSLQGMCGVPSVDDDGNMATQNAPKQSAPTQKQNLTPGHKLWQRAIDSYNATGSLDAVMQHVNISDENIQLLKEQAEKQAMESEKND